MLLATLRMNLLSLAAGALPLASPAGAQAQTKPDTKVVTPAQTDALATTAQQHMPAGESSDASAKGEAGPDLEGTEGEGQKPATAEAGAAKKPEADQAASAAAVGAAAIPENKREVIGEPVKLDLPSASGNGSLAYKIDIDVAPFRGTEPQLSLTYDPSRKTKVSGLYQGWLGYAWGLSGFDVIERGSFNFGMPAWKPNDTPMLNGQQMIACGPGVTSPSCATGGNYATENVRRITYVTGSNEWKVRTRTAQSRPSSRSPWWPGSHQRPAPSTLISAIFIAGC